MAGLTKEADRHVDAVLAALDVLDSFLSTPSMTAKQLAEHTGLTRNRVIRLTGTLLHRGYLMRDEEHNAYLPGPRIRLLNKAFEDAHGIVLLVRPILKHIVQKTGETASMFVRDGWERVVVAREEGPQAIRYSAPEGQHMDLHAGAAGKVLLAFASEETVDEFLSNARLLKRTDQTITNALDLKKEMAKIRRHGFAESCGERNVDAAAVSAPVFDGTRSLVGALSIAGPLNRFSKDNRKFYATIILDAAKKLSAQLSENPERLKKEI